MKTKSISFALFVIGIVYMAIDGWLISWWFFPDYRTAGPAFFTNTSFYTSQSFFTFWSLSVPLGSVLTAFGLALYAKLEKTRILIFIGGAIILLAWLGIWHQSVLYPMLYGIGGGVILFAFCTSIWSLAKVREKCKKEERNMYDFRALGYIFFVITAWGLCGLLGIPAFGLRPEKLLEFDSKIILLTMGAKVLICFALGFVFLTVSQYMEYRLHKKAT